MTLSIATADVMAILVCTLLIAIPVAHSWWVSK
jgi:hypothetical protein